ncbi:TrkH family potassium uptake protein [Pseudalkalibacillus caeni]|uniref:TrkH family potassium uptake protein n=1 Tax=Exobacillus caeni TaxID=2574798 RepID=A0A5R9F3P5_9BACL|nr:TrkH family potassium uptake protein [Pseudalkalibacillus caeni]TLS38227.1 TrkH family potassium uptake protein [Pseudalkalibacillus caeni]
MKLRNNAIRLSSVQLIVLFYFSAVFISTVLLSLPFAHRPGVEWHFIDALFTAVSAISVTGLTVVSTVDTFSVPGVFILAFVLQFGGIGIMTLGTFIWLVMGKKIGLKERQLISTDQNRGTLSGLVQLMKQILSLILLFELVGTVILGLYFHNYFPTWGEAFYQGFFASVSATTNAGFDITGESLIPFAQDYFVQTINIILLILGAIGFPVLIEIKDFMFSFKSASHYRFSLFTKLTTFTFFALIVIGALLILLLEKNHFFAGKSWHESFFYALFQSVTTRNGGLATMDINEFTVATQLVISVLMFIGASPSSVGGGIRTTTFAISLLTIFFFAKGHSNVKIFKRELDQDDIRKSFVVVFTAVLLTGSAIVFLSAVEPFPVMAIIFEVCSAFGTTGLSLGITPELSTVGKVTIIFMMFIGRIGIISFLFLLRGKVEGDHYHYPKERVIIG